MSNEMGKIREAIKKKDAKWKAEKTSVSELSDEEKESMLGLIPKEEELIAFKKKKK